MRIGITGNPPPGRTPRTRAGGRSGPRPAAESRSGAGRRRTAPDTFWSRQTPSGPQGAPWLEQERDIGGFTRIADCPRLAHRAGLRAGFAAADDPMNPVQVYRPPVFQQRFHRQETDAGRNWVQRLDARQVVAILPVTPSPTWAGTGRDEKKRGSRSTRGVSSRSVCREVGQATTRTRSIKASGTSS